MDVSGSWYIEVFWDTQLDLYVYNLAMREIHPSHFVLITCANYQHLAGNIHAY